MAIRDPKDLAAGLMFMAVGGSAIVIAANYPLGSAAKMGPGYFPTLLGILLVVFGAILALRSLWQDGQPIKFGSVVPAVWVLGSVLLFGFGLPHLGLVLSAVLVVLMSSLASKSFRLKQAVLSSIVLAAISVAGFVYGLGLRFPAWPTFFGAG